MSTKILNIVLKMNFRLDDNLKDRVYDILSILKKNQILVPVVLYMNLVVVVPIILKLTVSDKTLFEKDGNSHKTK